MAQEIPAVASEETAAPELDDAAAVDPAAEEAEPAAPAAKPPVKFDLDAAVKEDLAWRRTRKAQETDLETRRRAVDEQSKKFEPLAPFLEHLPKVDQAAVLKAVAALAAGNKIAAAEALFGFDPKFVSDLADHVGENYVPSEIPVADQVKAALAADKEATEKAEREAQEKKQADDKAEFDAEIENYLTTTARVLKTADFAEKFPLCSSLAHRLPVERIREEVTRRARAGESVELVDVLPKFEKEFEEDWARTPLGRKPVVSGERFDDRFAAEEAKFFGEEAPVPAPRPAIIPVRDGGQAPRAPAPGARKSGTEEIDAELARLQAGYEAGQRSRQY